MKLLFENHSVAGSALVRFVNKEDAAARTGACGKEFSGDAGSLFLSREESRRICWVGMGPGPKVTSATWRIAAGAAARRLVSLGEHSVEIDETGAAGQAAAIAEGAAIGAYTFDRYKTKDRREVHLEALVMPGLDAAAQAEARTGVAIAQAVNHVRDIGNTPPNILTPERLAEEALAIAGRVGGKVRIWDEVALRRDGFGGILAVGGGSINAPRFILIERKINPDWPTVAIVGKAITFDSGGLCIKPRAAMDEMKYDKMGGVAALGITEGIAALNLPINTVTAICSAENMVGAGAFRPSDVIHIYGGKSVEVIDTDAEGRLVLADGISYVRQNHKPDLILDLATLTGACCVALGLHRAGVFSPDDELATTIVQAGEETGDRAWRLPLGADYAGQLKSRIADIVNLPGSRWGGASTAAEFLHYFVEDSRWAHIDIAGPALLLDNKPEMEPGASGAGVRMVVEALRRMYG